MLELYVYAKQIFVQYLIELINEKAKIFEKIIDVIFINEAKFNELIISFYKLYEFSKNEIIEFRNSEKYKRLKNINDETSVTNQNYNKEINILEFEINENLYNEYVYHDFYELSEILKEFYDNLSKDIKYNEDNEEDGYFQYYDYCEKKSLKYLSVKYWDMLFQKYEDIQKTKLLSIKNNLKKYLIPDLANLIQYSEDNVIKEDNNNYWILNDWKENKKHHLYIFNKNNIIKNDKCIIDDIIIPGYIIVKPNDKNNNLNYVVDLDQKTVYGIFNFDKYQFEILFYAGDLYEYGLKKCSSNLIELKKSQIQTILDSNNITSDKYKRKSKSIELKNNDLDEILWDKNIILGYYVNKINNYVVKLEYNYLFYLCKYINTNVQDFNENDIEDLLANKLNIKDRASRRVEIACIQKILNNQ